MWIHQIRKGICYLKNCDVSDNPIVAFQPIYLRIYANWIFCGHSESLQNGPRKNRKCLCLSSSDWKRKKSFIKRSSYGICRVQTKMKMQSPSPCSNIIKNFKTVIAEHEPSSGPWETALVSCLWRWHDKCDYRLWTCWDYWANPKSGQNSPFTTQFGLNKIHFGYKLSFLSIFIQERVIFGKEQLNFIHAGASFGFYFSHLRF